MLLVFEVNKLPFFPFGCLYMNYFLSQCMNGILFTFLTYFNINSKADDL